MVSDDLLPIRLEPGEELAFTRAVMRHFHEDSSDDELRPWVEVLRDRDDYRAWVVRDRGAIVANYGVYAMTMSVPGGAPVGCAGVTAVGVAQTHRRRGLLRATMTAALDDARERGEPVAALYASESAIYGRFGFGITAPSVEHRIDRGAAFRDPVDPRLVEPATPEEAASTWPKIFQRLRQRRSGCVSRGASGWRLSVLEDPPSWRNGASARRLVHVPGRGYATYRVKEGFRDNLPDGEVRVGELVATDPEAEAALWQHVCDIDLTSRVRSWLRPPDDPLTQLLVDPLRARTHVSAPLYTRLLDVPKALTSRTYSGEGRVTLRIHDADRDQSGTYRLDAGRDGAEVARVTDEPDLTMPVDVAASVWLGGVRATQLLGARRLEEHVAGSAARLDRLAAVEHAPWTPFEF
jgi:predicted acetyltransferase